MNIYMASYPAPDRAFVKIYHVELILWKKISNWAQLVIISFSSCVGVAKRYSKNRNIFVNFLKTLKKNYGEKLDFAKNCFHILPWMNVNLNIGTSSKARLTLTVRTVSVYIAKANDLMGILFILLYKGLKHH